MMQMKTIAFAQKDTPELNICNTQESGKSEFDDAVFYISGCDESNDTGTNGRPMYYDGVASNTDNVQEESQCVNYYSEPESDAKNGKYPSNLSSCVSNR